jgi:hypothetical protein
MDKCSRTFGSNKSWGCVKSSGNMNSYCMCCSW